MHKKKYAFWAVNKKILQDQAVLSFYPIETLQNILHHSLSVHPSIAYASQELANFLVNTGQPELAQTYYQLSLASSLKPDTYSLFLQCLLLSPSCSEEQLNKESANYHHLFLKSIPFFKDHLTNAQIDKKLNIGYVCHFFHNSVSQSLLLPFLKEHNRERIRVFCYSDTLEGEVDKNITSIADVWCDTKHLTDEELAHRIRDDRIDILLELNGHCIINRYAAMARKPAPIQLSYYNLCATSGIPAIDYILVGKQIQIKEKSSYTESVYYLPDAPGIAQFPDFFPPCAPSPYLKNGYITFGSFGAAHKVNAQVIKLWCQVLKKIPTAKFFMKAGVLSHQAYLDGYRKMFQAEGIDHHRVYFEGYSEHVEMLKCYGQVDIALDTFPAQGGTTTMEALWQGVPVITLCGERYSMQVGKMILTCIGHPELVTVSEEEFVQKALSLATNLDQLLIYRNQLRQDFKHSPLANAAVFAKNLEDSYQDMWKKYCEKISRSLESP